jgi:hypothetical protein
MFAIAACFSRDFAGNQAAVKALEESSQLASESKEELVIVMVQLNPDAPPIERDLERLKDRLLVQLTGTK